MSVRPGLHPKYRKPPTVTDHTYVARPAWARPQDGGGCWKWRIVNGLSEPKRCAREREEHES